MTAAATFDGDTALALPLWSIGHGETVAIVDRCRLIVFHMSAFLWMRWHVAVSLCIVYDMIWEALAMIWGKIFIHSNVYVESHCVNFRANVIIVRWRKIFDDASMSHVELCCGFFSSSHYYGFPIFLLWIHNSSLEFNIFRQQRASDAEPLCWWMNL